MSRSFKVGDVLWAVFGADTDVNDKSQIGYSTDGGASFKVLTDASGIRASEASAGLMLNGKLVLATSSGLFVQQ